MRQVEEVSGWSGVKGLAGVVAMQLKELNIERE